jgi:predicted CopG family antitoxin
MCTHTQNNMGTKTISITDDVYERLKAMKTPGESFSDELRRLTTSKGSILDFAGAWKDLSEEDSKKMKENIREKRKDKSRLEEVNKKWE